MTVRVKEMTVQTRDICSKMQKPKVNFRRSTTPLKETKCNLGVFTVSKFLKASDYIRLTWI